MKIVRSKLLIIEIAFSQTSSELQSSFKELKKNDQIYILQLTIQAGDAYGYGTNNIGNLGDQQFAAFVSRVNKYLGFAASTISN